MAESIRAARVQRSKVRRERLVHLRACFQRSILRIDVARSPCTLQDVGPETYQVVIYAITEAIGSLSGPSETFVRL